MGYTATYPRPEKTHPTAKNRVWGFFAEPNKTRPANRLQPAQPRREIDPTTTKLASGVFYYGYRYYDPVTGRWPSRDPIGERGGLNLYVHSSNAAIAKIDPNGLTVYEPDEWNDEEHLTSNNCYSYACNDKDGHAPGDKAGPGRPSGGEAPENRFDCKHLKGFIVADGAREVDCDKPCDCSEYKIILFTGVTSDGRKSFHFYRQDQDGTWSHKPGHLPATNIDDSGNTISDPLDADRSKTYPGLKPCACFCLPWGGIDLDEKRQIEPPKLPNLNDIDWTDPDDDDIEFPKDGAVPFDRN